MAEVDDGGRDLLRREDRSRTNGVSQRLGGGITNAPEVAGGALEFGRIGDSGAPEVAAGGSIIGKVSDTRLIGLEALPELLRKL